MSTAVVDHLTELWETPQGLRGFLSTVDHKQLGMRYMATAMLFLLIGGIEALIIRVQLAYSNQSLLTPEAYNQIFTMHAITMIFWYAQPILSGFSIYLIPLMIGARDLAFPRANAFSYYAFLLSGLFLYVSLALRQSPHAGWFAYPPYTDKPFSPGYGMDFYAIALLFFTISSTVGAINLIVTIFRLRAPGMAISKMPLLCYSTLSMSFSSVFAMPSLAVACVFLELQRRWGFHFYDVAHGGMSLLWQQLFWFFGHPWVYVVFLPATGMISMLLPVFSRRPIVGYPYVALSTVLTAIVGFGVWVHHMFAVGMSHMSMSFFSAASMTISIFSAIQVFAWIGTMWKGRPVMTASMHFAVGFIALLVIGGLNGIVTAVIPVDWQLTDTYFVVSHLHYVLVGTNMVPVFAGFYYWWPKMTGRMLSESLGKWSFWIIFAGINLAFFPMHLSAIKGMPRRIYTYPYGLGIEGLNTTSTIGAFILGIGIALTLANFYWSLRRGAIAGNNPWNADTLEWSSSSPPPPYGSVHLPTVRTRHPLWDDHDEEYDPGDRRVFDNGRFTISSTMLDADPVALARMPKDSMIPLYVTLAMTLLFAAVISDRLWLALGAAALNLILMAFWMWPKQQETPA